MYIEINKMWCDVLSEESEKVRNKAGDTAGSRGSGFEPC